MHIFQSESRRVSVLVLSIAISVFHSASFTNAELSPVKRLAFYYGFPSAVNGASGNLDQVVDAGAPPVTLF